MLATPALLINISKCRYLCLKAVANLIMEEKSPRSRAINSIFSLFVSFLISCKTRSDSAVYLHAKIILALIKARHLAVSLPIPEEHPVITTILSDKSQINSQLAPS